MVTKQQWKDFCSYVYSAKSMGLSPNLYGRTISKVDLTNGEIITIKQNEQIIKYKHPDSIGNYHTLMYLFSSISFSHISLKDIIKFTNVHKMKGKKLNEI